MLVSDLSRVAVAHLTVAAPSQPPTATATIAATATAAAAATTLTVSARARAHACDALFGAGETSVATLILECLLKVRAQSHDHVLISWPSHLLSLFLCNITPTQPPLFLSIGFVERLRLLCSVPPLLQCSRDVRASVATNLVLCGGGAHLPGLGARLLDELGAEARAHDRFQPLTGMRVCSHPVPATPLGLARYSC